MVDTTVLIFSVIGFTGTFLNCLYYGIRAYTNKTGPRIVSSGTYMLDYSGHFEIDMLPMFINLVTALQYLGEILETIETRVGFFNVYRYASYLLTCPLMVYELCYTIGAPYRVSMTTLTFFSITSALFADTATTLPTRWSWFSIGCFLNVMFFSMLFKIRKHAINLNKLICSDKHIKKNIQRQLNMNDFPEGIIQIKTPMDDKTKYIEWAFWLIYFLWPIFPLMFCLEYSGYIDRNFTQIIFAVNDLVIKSAHSYFLDIYKSGICETLVPYGFLDTSILYELELTKIDTDIYSQLKSLSRAIYGDLIVGKKGVMKDLGETGIDFQSMLVAGRLNQKVDDWDESNGESITESNIESNIEPDIESNRRLWKRIEQVKEQQVRDSQGSDVKKMLSPSMSLRSMTNGQSSSRSLGIRRGSISKVTPVTTPVTTQVTTQVVLPSSDVENPNLHQSPIWH